MKVLIACGIIAYVACNLVTAKLFSAKEMKRNFVDGQCIVGKIFANAFYAPAWAMKILRFVILTTVK